jgi:hypothetical protein
MRIVFSSKLLVEKLRKTDLKLHHKEFTTETRRHSVYNTKSQRL